MFETSVINTLNVLELRLSSFMYDTIKPLNAGDDHVTGTGWNFPKIVPSPIYRSKWWSQFTQASVSIAGPLLHLNSSNRISRWMNKTYVVQFVLGLLYLNRIEMKWWVASPAGAVKSSDMTSEFPSCSSYDSLTSVVINLWRLLLRKCV